MDFFSLLVRTHISLVAGIFINYLVRSKQICYLESYDANDGLLGSAIQFNNTRELIWFREAMQVVIGNRTIIGLKDQLCD